MAESGVIRTCILSHGRSGTVYTATVLSSIGLDFGHEEDGTDGCIGGIFFHGNRNLDSYDQIFHQVRNPLDVISSSTTCRPSSFTMMFKEIGAGTIREADPLIRAMLSWDVYTTWAEEHSTWRYRIEDFTRIWPELLFRMNVSNQELPNVPSNMNSRLHHHYTWNDLSAADKELSDKIYDKARWYGYETSAQADN